MTFDSARLPPARALLILAPLVALALTLVAWKTASSSMHEHSLAAFQKLVTDNELALTSRIDLYEHALRGGVELGAANPQLTREQWSDYIQGLDLKRRLPAVSGIGFVRPVDAQARSGFENDMRRSGVAEFAVHPAEPNDPLYVTTYVEPEALYKEVIGLNLAFETRRREAAEHARDTGSEAISQTISLLDSSQGVPGFLWLAPIYNPTLPQETVEQRRSALVGWVSASFTGKALLRRLTPAQGVMLNMTVYGGPAATQENLLYSDDQSSTSAAAFRAQKSLNILQQKWIVEWRSTPGFETAQRSDVPLIVLIAGLATTLILAAFVTSTMIRRQPESDAGLESLAGHVLPLIVFIVSVAAVVALYRVLDVREERFVRGIVAERAAQIRLLVDAEAQGKLYSLRRMARRWTAANGTPEDQWRRDAANHINQLDGLRAVEWVDTTYHVRWVEPISGNEKAVGLNVVGDPERAAAFEAAVAHDAGMFTSPLDLVQGYRGVIAYSPVLRHNQFDGFLAAVFSLDEFFTAVLSPPLLNDFDIRVQADGRELFAHDLPSSATDDPFADTSAFPLAGKQWEMRITPSTEFTSRYRTRLPPSLLIAGLAIAALLALTVRAVLLARLRAQRLAESNKLNEGIMASAGALIVATDKEGRVTRFNRAAELALGYKASEVVAQHTPVLWHDPAELSARAAQLSAQYGEPVRAGFSVFSTKLAHTGREAGEWTLIRRDGTSFPATLIATTLRDANGNVAGYLGIAEDITQRKAAEQERLRNEARLRLTEERYRLLIDGLADYAICWLDPSGAVTIWNVGARNLMQYDDLEIVGKPFDCFFSEEDRALRLPAHELKAATETGRYASEGWRVRRDGGRFWASVRLEPVRHLDGSLMGFAMILHDESARREAVEALRQSEATFRGALESASIGMALVKPNGNWLKVNPAICALLGYTEQELLANDFQSITHPEDLGRDMDFVVKMLAGEIATYRLEKRYFHSSGRIVWALLSVSLARDSRGQPLYFVSQIQDITEQKEIERLKTEFISVVSHELRTPLTSIRGSLGLILGSMADSVPQNVKTLLDIAHNNCERLIPLINDILDIDKMASGKMRFDVQEHSLARVASSAVEEMQPYAQKLNVTVALTPVDADLAVAVDETRLIQVLSNLISNAAKFSPPGSQVSVEARAADGRVRLFVRDTGPGIPEAFRARIFEKFSQADSSSTRRAGGTGLGLHITRQIVERMNGRVGFDSSVGTGTTFWVEFPLVPARSPRIPATPAQSSPVRSVPAILHVEDDTDLSNVIAAALRDHARVVLARDLRQAEEYLRQQQFSLLLLDLNLSDASGVQLLDRLRSLGVPPIPTVILSAEAPSHDIELQVDAVMVKTRVSEARVVQTILEVLSASATTADASPSALDEPTSV
jgi:PAS domain S-box-containing protein